MNKPFINAIWWGMGFPLLLTYAYLGVDVLLLKLPFDFNFAAIKAICAVFAVYVYCQEMKNEPSNTEND